MEMSQQEGMERTRIKKEAQLQMRLACRLYGVDDPNEALMRWTSPHDSVAPAEKIRAYLPQANLEATTPEELDEILRAAGIHTTRH